MSDRRRLKSIASRYDLEVTRHRDPWRGLRSRLSCIFAVGSIAASLPWLLGDHRAFQSQCVSQAHRVFEQDCQSCHDRSLAPLLRMVTFDNTIHSTSDKKCRVCHGESNEDHLSPSISSAARLLSKPTEGTAELRGGREETLKQKLQAHFSELGCAGCHQEHRGHSQLADVADAHCSQCHSAAHDQVSPQRFELNFSDFGHHPEFAIWRNTDRTTTVPVEDRREPTLVKCDQDRPVDQAAIKFSHHRHLDPQLPLPGGKTIEISCVDCHQPDASGAYFRPLTFEQNCQRCHTLGFPSTGELPHSQPEIIRGILLDRLAKNRDGKRPAATDELGGPTKAPITAIKTDSDAPPSLATLERELEKLEQQLFATPHPERSNELPRVAGLLEAACTKCHFTERTGGVGETWKVTPPRLPEQWMSHSRFRHDRHSSVDCQACHTRNGQRIETVKREQFYPVIKGEWRASPSIYASESARDVLMPRIDICRQCHGHGSAPGSRSVGDRCVDCHAYHHTPLSSEPRPGIAELLQAVRPRISGAKPADPAAEAGP